MHEGKYSWNKITSHPSQGCGNLVPKSPNTASGETSIHALRADVERESNVGICLAN